MDPIEDMAQPFTDNSQHAFIKSASAAFIGSMVGAQLNNTTFGRWFNTSKLVGFMFNVLQWLIVGLVVYYLYLVFIIW